jgi:uncharacterized protein (UPF0297 family)
MFDGTKKIEKAPSSSGSRAILAHVFRSLEEKGYSAENQIVGYLVSEDPQYITSHNGARALIVKLDRDEVIAEMLREYLEAEGL